jgi:ligand-binding sensor domain-containing protein
MRLKAVFLYLLLMIAGKNLNAQRLLFTTYSMNEGLVHNAIRTIYQDTKGFIWIGTWEGLSMYDGNKFTNYTTRNGLSHAVVNEIYESKDGGIYIACNNGSLDIIKNNGTPARVRQDAIINHLEVVNNKIIATTDKNGLCEFKDGKLFKPKQAYPYKNYYHITRFNDSLFLAQSDSSVQLLNERYELFAEWNEATPFFAECGLLIDSKKRVWVGTVNGLKLLSPQQEKGKPLRLLELPATFNIPEVKDHPVRDMLEDDAGNIWIGTSVCLVRIGADGSRQLITAKDGLPTNDVSCIFQDREKTIWVGGSRGIAKLVTKTIIRIYTTMNGLLSDNITSLLPVSNGNMIIESGKELQLFEKTKALFTPLAAGNNYYSGDGPNSSLSLMTERKTGNHFLTLFQNSADHIFFSPSSDGSYSAVKDQRGNFFYPSYTGVWFSHDFANWTKSLFYPQSRSLLIDSKGVLWVGSLDSGLFRIQYDYINDTPRVLHQEHYLPGTGIRSLYEDSKGWLWIGTRYNGVYRMRPGDSTILHFDQSMGLTSNRITSIGEDKAGSIWINFYNGLDKLIPAGNSYRVFNFSRFNNFFTNIQSMVFDNEHSLWLATTQGAVNITDGQIESMEPLRTYIMSVSSGDSVYQDHDGKKIILDYRHKQVQFGFAAPGFINEKQLQFSYRLLGSNNTDWSNTSNEHSVSYANLEPGDYRFEVRNKGWNDKWGEPAYCSFKIHPPFWQTAWFISLCTLLVATIIIWLVRRRIKAIRKESSLRQRIAETEMSALRAQMNPHFIFNCISAIDNMIQTDQKDKATKYLTQFAKLIRGVLESSKNNLVAFYKDHESLLLYLQLEQFRSNNRFEYELYADPEILNSDIKVPPLIAQPFVENAIHHGLMNKTGADRKLIVQVKLEKDLLKYTIEDNGIGRKKAQLLKSMDKPEHLSYGIEISKKRIDLHNDNRKYEAVIITDLGTDDDPAGTRVELWLSLK